eukprot:CAMPEP_0115221288 /NCGR_PEP_ID=MMETSP0270-20121206/27889_1 /TAXON_ID=71861 /ORGANISM="Scrippsiella trochoidea, Strain CCMP3099" /LENGTH=159 /DNA_ID=CAMNT_0002635377 /DNA_START=56 /DNA_END=535 /DNA_ORIENTATION=-
MSLPIPAPRRQRSVVAAVLAAATAALALPTAAWLGAGFAGQSSAPSGRRLAVTRRAAAAPALDQWMALGRKGEELEKVLDSLEFEGTSADGGVTVVVNGRQRPVGVRLAENLAIAGDLGSLVVEAHNKAVEASMVEMTAKLQELYAEYFKETAANNAQA